jgi:hypothetical protein
MAEAREPRSAPQIDTDESDPCMIYPHAGMFEMCFPYGPQVEQERGHGRIVRPAVAEVPETCTSSGGSGPELTTGVEGSALVATGLAAPLELRDDSDA